MGSSTTASAKVPRAVGAGLRFVRVSLHRFVVGVGYLLVTGVFLSLLHDMGLIIGSKEMYDYISVIEVVGPHPEEIGAYDSWLDFDGDGFPDELRSDWNRVEPVFGKRTLGILEVISGRTGAVLLAHPTSVPGWGEGWCEDYDGNGTVDVFVRGGGACTVLGFVGDQP